MSRSHRILKMFVFRQTFIRGFQYNAASGECQRGEMWMDVHNLVAASSSAMPYTILDRYCHRRCRPLSGSQSYLQPSCPSGISLCCLHHSPRHRANIELLVNSTVRGRIPCLALISGDGLMMQHWYQGKHTVGGFCRQEMLDKYWWQSGD